jgi:hypothetical protein
MLILSCGCRYPTQGRARRSSNTNRARGNNNQVTSGSVQQYPVAAVAASYRRTSDRVAATVRRTTNPALHMPRLDSQPQQATGFRMKWSDCKDWRNENTLLTVLLTVTKYITG